MATAMRILSFRDLLNRHKDVTANWMATSCPDFFSNFDALFTANNYVTRRSGLKLLSELLVDKSFIKATMLYIADAQHLKMHMELLRSKPKHMSRILCNVHILGSFHNISSSKSEQTQHTALLRTRESSRSIFV